MTIELGLRWLITVVIVLMPLLAPMWLGAEYIFQPTPEDLKTAFGVTGVFLSLFIWSVIQYKKGLIVLQKSDFYIPIIGFLAWCLVTLFWVEDGFLAILMLVQFFSYALVFFLVINAFKTVENIELMLKLLTITLLVISMIGLLQYYLTDNNFIQNLFLQAHQPGSTFANKNMSSHFVVMTLPLAIVFLLCAQKFRGVIIYSVVTFTAFLFLMYTHARQGYLAIAIEISALVLFILIDYIKNKNKSLVCNIRKRKEKSLAISMIIVLLIVTPNISTTNSSGDSKISQKISQITIQGGSGRFPAWLNTIEMIKDHPIQGVGIGQWPESYPKYYDSAERDVIFNEKLRLGRLHNDYLEMFANVGLIGYLFLLWIGYLTIQKIIFVLSDVSNNNRGLVLGVSLGLLGFSVAAMFSFPIRVYLPAFLVFAYLSLISIVSSKQKVKEISFKKIKKYLLVVMVILGFLFLFIGNKSYNWLMGQHHYITALSYMKTGHIESAKNEGLIAINYNSWAQEYYHMVAKALASTVSVESAIPYYKKVIDISPFNTTALLDLSLSYQLTDNIKMERKVLDFVLRFDSKNVRAASRLVVNLIDSMEYKSANIVYKNLKNNFEYFKDRQNFGPYHIEVAQTAMHVKDYRYVSYIYKDLIKSDPTSKNYATLASIEYYFLDNKSQGVEYYKKALELEPNLPKNEEIKDLISSHESGIK